MTEKDIERKLVQGIRALGGMALKFISPGNNGVPDRVVLLPGGRVRFVELKTETGRLSAVQSAVHRKFAKCGIDVVTLYGLEDVKEFLRQLEDYKTEGGDA